MHITWYHQKSEIQEAYMSCTCTSMVKQDMAPLGKCQHGGIWEDSIKME
jgi:hypothetical protein